jgi:hypothetical protein
MSYVSMLRSGLRRPGYRVAARIEIELGIRMSDWATTRHG